MLKNYFELINLHKNIKENINRILNEILLNQIEDEIQILPKLILNKNFIEKQEQKEGEELLSFLISIDFINFNEQFYLSKRNLQKFLDFLVESKNSLKIIDIRNYFAKNELFSIKSIANFDDDLDLGFENNFEINFFDFTNAIVAKLEIKLKKKNLDQNFVIFLFFLVSFVV